MTRFKRMFAEGEFTTAEGERNAAARLMAELDSEAAKNGVAVTGSVEIMASDPSVFTGTRVMRLEADVVTR